MTFAFNKKIFAAALMAASSLGAVSVAQAQTTEEGNWLIRLRAVHLDSANKGSASGNLGAPLTINNKWLPEVDFTYFFTPNIAAELILTYPQKQSVYLGGSKLGTFKHLPPTLTAQYHFTNLPYGIKPYVGAGINYTRISSDHISAGPDTPVTLKSNSFGGALQVGVDVPVAKNVYFNFDVKKVFIKTDVKVAGDKVGSFKVDPWLIGVGVGYRF